MRTAWGQYYSAVSRRLPCSGRASPPCVRTNSGSEYTAGKPARCTETGTEIKSTRHHERRNPDEGLGWRTMLLAPVEFEKSIALKTAGEKLGDRPALFYVAQ